MRVAAVFLGIMFTGLMVAGQSSEIYLSRYLPGGSEIVDAEVSIFNASESVRDLSGYVLATRYWQIVLPAGISIPAYSSLTFASTEGDDVLYLRDFPGFSPISPTADEIGDFVALFPRVGGSLMDGLYLSEQSEVGFLPMSVKTPRGVMMEVPGEMHSKWSYYPVQPDPYMAYDRNQGSWQANARKKDLFPATNYLYLQGRAIESGEISIKWKTEFETNCRYHRIEKSTDGISFEEIGRWKGQKESYEFRDYQFTDAEIDPLVPTYYYRIRHIDQVGNAVSSDIIPISPSAASGFHFNVFKEGPETGQYLRIRYSAEQAQEVNLKLLDEQLRQVEVLSSGPIEPNRQYLVTYQKSLATGVYYLMVETEGQRYHEVVVIQ